MIININPDYRMRSTADQWIIEACHTSEGKKTAGETIWTPKAYVRTPQGAVEWLARYSIYPIEGEYDFEALAALNQTLDAIRADCRKIVEAMA